MKKLIFLIVLLFSVSSVFAQEEVSNTQKGTTQAFGFEYGGVGMYGHLSSFVVFKMVPDPSQPIMLKIGGAYVNNGTDNMFAVELIAGYNFFDYEKVNVYGTAGAIYSYEFDNSLVVPVGIEAEYFLTPMFSVAGKGSFNIDMLNLPSMGNTSSMFGASFYIYF